MEDSEVSARLSALPSPAMPDDVVAAIEDRLAQEQKVVPLTRRHTRRLNWLVAAAALVGVMALIGVGTGGSTPAPVAQPPVVRAGAVFEPAGFAEQLRSRMGAQADTQPTRTFADSPVARQACASAVQAYGPMMSIDVGTYDKGPAVVMVTSYLPSAEYEEVWVVSPTCGEGDAVVYRHFLYDVDGSISS